MTFIGYIIEILFYLSWILSSAIFYLWFFYLLSFTFCLLSSAFFGRYWMSFTAFNAHHTVLSIWVEFNEDLKILFDLSKSTKKILKLEMKY